VEKFLNIFLIILYFIFTEGGEIAGLEDAFIMFNNLFKTDLDLYVGQFQVADPLFKRELRLTYEDYRIYGVKVGQAMADLTYDRGVMLTYGLPTGTDLTLEIVNGMGLDPVDDFGTFDNDKYKNFMLRVSQDFSPLNSEPGLSAISGRRGRITLMTACGWLAGT